MITDRYDFTDFIAKLIPFLIYSSLFGSLFLLLIMIVYNILCFIIFILGLFS